MNEVPDSRPLPHDLESERAVLASMIDSPDCFDAVSDVLTPADFHAESHRLIFDAMTDLRAIDTPIDLRTIQTCMKTRGEWEAVGAEGYMATLSRAFAKAENVTSYARRVRDCSDKRRAIEICNRATESLYCEQTTIESVTDTLISEAIKLGSSRNGHCRNFAQIMEEVRQVVHDAQDAPPPKGICCGIPKVDDSTWGLEKEKLTVLAACTGHGKSTLAMQYVLDGAAKHGTVYVASLEMGEVSLGVRLLSATTRMDSLELRGRGGRRLSAGELQTVDRECARLGKLPIVIDTRRKITPEQIVRRARAFTEPLALVCVDYLGLLDVMRKDLQRQDQMLSEAAASMKGLAIDLHIPTLLVHQVTPPPGVGKDWEPTHENLRGSRDIAMHSDTVLVLNVPKSTSPEPRGTVTVSKSRDGRSNVRVDVVGRLYCHRFEQLDASTQAPEPEEDPYA